MKKMMFLSQNWYFSVQKALIYYTFNKSHHNSFILLVFLRVANFRYVANFTFLTLHTYLVFIKHWYILGNIIPQTMLTVSLCQPKRKKCTA